jgi:hypothetical protein
MSVKPHGAVLLLVSILVGCSTTRVVRLDTGQGQPIVYAPPDDAKPIQIGKDAFKQTLRQLLLQQPPLTLRPEQEDRASRVEFASSKQEPTGCQASSRSYEQFCAKQPSSEDCTWLLHGGFALDTRERHILALGFALEGVWGDVEKATRDRLNPASAQMMLASALHNQLESLTKPKPATQGVAVSVAAHLIAYLSPDRTHAMVEGFLRLMKESEQAASFSEMKEAGHQWRKVMGDDGMRTLLLVAAASLSGRRELLIQGRSLPGYAQARHAAEANAGFKLDEAAAGEVRSVHITAEAITLGLTPKALAPTARGQKGGGGTRLGNFR